MSSVESRGHNVGHARCGDTGMKVKEERSQALSGDNTRSDVLSVRGAMTDVLFIYFIQPPKLL